MTHKTKPIKVCHLTSAHSRDDVRIFHKECLSISNAGYLVHLVVADGLGNQVKERIEICDVGNSRGRFHRFSVTMWRVLRAALNVNADIYHFHDPELIPVGLWLRFKNKKVIYDVHEDLPRQILAKEWIHPWLRKTISVITEAVENFAARKFSVIVTATPFIASRFEEIGAKAININNYPILKEFNRIYNWGSRKDQICYVGGISKVRGIIPLVESFSKLDVKLHLAGRFSPSSLKGLLMQQKGWENVIEYGVVDRKKVQEILAASKVGIVTLLPIVKIGRAHV